MLENEITKLKSQQTADIIKTQEETSINFYTQKDFKKVITEHIARSYPNNQHQALAFYEENEPFITAVKSRELCLSFCIK